MTLSRDAIGKQYEPYTDVVDEQLALAFAEATCEHAASYRDSQTAPPLFAVRLAARALDTVLHDAELGLDLAHLLHAEQRVELDRPLRWGERVRVEGRIVAIEPYALGQACRVALEVVDEQDGRPTRLDATLVVPADRVSGERRRRPRPPARGELVGEASRPVPADLPRRYADASGDVNPIHLDDAVARAAGLPGVILHGMCTLAMGADAAIELAGGGDPSRLAAIAARFSRPVRPGDEIVYQCFRTDVPTVFVLGATVDGAAVLKDGVVEVRATRS